MEHVYTQTNDAERNEVVVFHRDGDGSLSLVGRYETGGKGNGNAHLPSQSSVALSETGRLLVANAGSDELSVFSISGDGLRHDACLASGGAAPTSVAVHGERAYVLNSGTPNIAGFTLGEGTAAALSGSVRELSAESADPAQVSFAPDGKTLVVTERGTDSISAFEIDADGYAHGPKTIPSSGATPYGFDFTRSGALVVTEAFGGEVGAAAASSYHLERQADLVPVSASVRNTRSEVCWAVVGKDGRFAYVTNFGDGTISRYSIADDGTLELVDAVAASTRLGEKGVRDETLSRDGRFLYALDADARRVFGWTVEDDGSLSPIGSYDGLPATVAGLAAS
jgi:6-phosphogluconolactonase